MKRVFIVTPAWGRIDVSKIVFSNFRYIKSALFKYGISVEVVVVADDANLSLAKKYGLKSVMSKNDYLGKKFNDGYQFAFNNGADLVIPVGSDSLISPSIIKSSLSMSKENTIVFSSIHSVIREDGKMIGNIKSRVSRDNPNKGALWLYRRNNMKRCGFRPCNEKINKGCDRSTIESLVKKNKGIRMIINDVNFYQHVGIKSRGVQICKYNDYRSQFSEEVRDPCIALKKHFPKSIIKNLKVYYEKQNIK